MSMLKVLPSGLLLTMFFSLTPVQSMAGCWTSQNYVDLYFRRFNGSVPLPHLRSAEQKVLLQHLIAPCNLTEIVQSTRSADQKLMELRIILASIGAYRSAYEVAVMVGEPLEQELALVQAYSLQAAEAAVGVSRTPMELHSTHAAWATMVAGVLDSIADTARYSPGQGLILAEAVARHYPAIASVLPEGDRQRLASKARDLDVKVSNTALQRAVAYMKNVVATAP